MFLWSFFPNYLFQALAVFDWVVRTLSHGRHSRRNLTPRALSSFQTWIAPRNVVVNQIFGCAPAESAGGSVRR